ncbi:MAG: DUF3047 domain-containing protein [Granulosicoccus sp.]|nr:DUF3047 domain-containing protein [Granulosicoccus sp.]
MRYIFTLLRVSTLGLYLSILALNLLSALLPSYAMGEQGLPIGAPPAAFGSSIEEWQERSFSGNTRYEMVNKQGVEVLKAHTQGNASILFRELPVDVSKTPLLNWTWMVDRTYGGIEEQSRAGDDFPARLYVVAQTGFLPWETSAINYVWASNAEVGEAWANPFTDQAIMIAVESGDSCVGKWKSHTRNVADDFKQHFGKDIDQLAGYAVMVDGDNAGLEATAWFGRIEFSAEP